MTDRVRTARDDLAYMRELVQADEEGGRVRGGRVIALGGFLFAACSAEVGAAANGWLPQAAWTLAYPWFITMAVFLAALFLMFRGARDAGGVRSRAAGVLWSAIGGAIGAIVLSCLTAQQATGSGQVWATLPSVILALYGAGWIVASTLSGRAWERAVGLGGFACAVAMAALAGTPQLVFFGYALGLVLLGGLPGLAMARGRPGA